jgi:N-glycosidase YbiA
MAIYFYSNREEPYGCFSNFSSHGVHLDGVFWPTTEHYFQAQKFLSEDDRVNIRRAPSPKEAANRGRDRSRPLREDWEAVKDDVMHRAVHAKFAGHPELRALLLSTGDQEIVENTSHDYYWGCGKDGGGKNMLGKILMKVREELRSQA